METQNYIVAWVVYLVSASAIALIGWRVLRHYLWRELAWLLEGFLLAILFTPWYVLPDEEVLAPAFIVFLMDSITIGTSSAIRALIPLVMAMLLAILVTVLMSLVYRLSRRRRRRDTTPNIPHQSETG